MSPHPPATDHQPPTHAGGERPHHPQDMLILLLALIGFGVTPVSLVSLVLAHRARVEVTRGHYEPSSPLTVGYALSIISILLALVSAVVVAAMVGLVFEGIQYTKRAMLWQTAASEALIASRVVTLDMLVNNEVPSDLSHLKPARQVDVWGRPYIYVPTEHGFELSSLGRDGQPGGGGIDADITFNERGMVSEDWTRQLDDLLPGDIAQANPWDSREGAITRAVGDHLREARVCDRHGLHGLARENLTVAGQEFHRWRSYQVDDLNARIARHDRAIEQVLGTALAQLRDGANRSTVVTVHYPALFYSGREAALLDAAGLSVEDAWTLIESVVRGALPDGSTLVDWQVATD